MEFLTAKGTGYKIQEIIDGSENRITIISPYLQLDHDVLERLESADKKGKITRIVNGKRFLQYEQKEAIVKRLANVELYFYGNLHAKCFFNEKMMVLGSMNLFDYSMRNREMGIWLVKGKEEDLEVFNKAVDEVDQIIEHSDKLHPKGSERRWFFCNKCGEPMLSEDKGTQHKTCENEPFRKRRNYKGDFQEYGYCHDCRRRDFRIGYRNSIIKTCKRCWKQAEYG